MRRARTRRARTKPTRTPTRAEAARCTEMVSGRGLRLARALQRAALVGADHLVLETLEEKLPAAAGAERLVTVVPDGRLPPGDVVVSGAKLLNGRPARARGHEHLAQAVAAEIAVKLSSKRHSVRNLQQENGEDRSFVPYTFDRPIRFPYP